MKAEEIRIGNWVYNGITRKEMQVYAMMIPQLDNLEKKMGCNIKPIPLTKEWLEKFGFKWKNGSLRLKDFSVHGHKYFMFLFSQGAFNNTNIKIKHVHQLQNLYFALTGEELELNK